ncbi:MAG: hypothetical protein Q8M16_24050 [Pirellulaceae bacterium]|nr:hypothetical protein [Pirellulaceae bacterium]
MHCSKLNVLAVALQVNADAICENSIERMSLLAQQYWTITRSRVSFWNQSLAWVQQAGQQPKTCGESFFVRVTELLEEVLLGQLHTNVWGAAWSYYDAKNKLGTNDRLGGLATGIVDSHRESVVRATDLVLWLSRYERSSADRILRLQRRIERWTDRLLVGFASKIDVQPFCFDLERVRDMLEVQAKTRDLPTMLMLIGGLQAAQLESGSIGFAKRMNHDLACLMLNLLPLNVLSEVRFNLDTSIMRSDQATWEMECLLERALCLDLAVTV